MNVSKKDPQVQIKIRDILDKCNRLPYISQSKLGYETLIQNAILKEINTMATTIVDIDIELKMKISRIECSESKNSYILNYFNINDYSIYHRT